MYKIVRCKYRKLFYEPMRSDGTQSVVDVRSAESVGLMNEIIFRHFPYLFQPIHIKWIGSKGSWDNPYHSGLISSALAWSACANGLSKDHGTGTLFLAACPERCTHFFASGARGLGQRNENRRESPRGVRQC